MMKKTFFETKLSVSIFKEGNEFIAYSPVLDLSTCGKNYNEVMRRFDEIVQIFFEEIAKKGTLNEVLENLGWKKVQKKWSPPVFISNESENIKIPMFA